MQCLKNISVGRPLTKFGRSLYPIYVVGAVQPSVVRGVGGASVSFAEAPSASVPDIGVENTGDVAALLPTGTVITGGLQNRVLNTSILVAPRERLTVPVSCVEQGRWRGNRLFRRQTSIAPRDVRTTMQRTTARRSDGYERADQSEVWSSVRRSLEERNAQNPTGNLEFGRNDSVNERRRRKIQSVVDAGPLPGQCGLAVMHGSTVVSIEIFATQELLNDHWEQLIRAIFDETDPTPNSRSSADRLLRELTKLARSEWRSEPSVGRGRTNVLVDSGFTGRVLEDAGTVIHAAMFAIAA